MLNKRIQLAIAVLVLVFAAAGEELLPPVFGVGVPLLLAGTVATARRRPVTTAVFSMAAFERAAAAGLPAAACASI